MQEALHFLTVPIVNWFLTIKVLPVDDFEVSIPGLRDVLAIMWWPKTITEGICFIRSIEAFNQQLYVEVCRLLNSRFFSSATVKNGDYCECILQVHFLRIFGTIRFTINYVKDPPRFSLGRQDVVQPLRPQFAPFLNKHSRGSVLKCIFILFQLSRINLNTAQYVVNLIA